MLLDLVAMACVSRNLATQSSIRAGVGWLGSGAGGRVAPQTVGPRRRRCRPGRPRPLRARPRAVSGARAHLSASLQASHSRLISAGMQAQHPPHVPKAHLQIHAFATCTCARPAHRTHPLCVLASMHACCRPRPPCGAGPAPCMGPLKHRGSPWRPPDCPGHKRFVHGARPDQLASTHHRQSYSRCVKQQS
jgi:hypothetical protein